MAALSFPTESQVGGEKPDDLTASVAPLVWTHFRPVAQKQLNISQLKHQ